MRQKRNILLCGILICIIGVLSFNAAFAQQLGGSNVITRDDPPQVTATKPANGEINVCRNTQVKGDVSFPAVPGNGVDPETLDSNTVFLYPTSLGEGAKVPAIVNTSGGNDTIILTPDNYLSASTNYTFRVTAGVTDLEGNPFEPFTMSFSTGLLICDSPLSDVHFTKFVAHSTDYDGKYSSVVVGPDHRLYATMILGNIRIFDINGDGTLTFDRDITTLAGRTLIGIAFDPSSTASNATIWVSNNAPYTGTAVNQHFTGKIDRFVGTNLNTGSENWSHTEMVTGLPRSCKDHLSNSLAFGPDGYLYMTQGSISAMGRDDGAWCNQPEVVLSAAVLRMDTQALAGLGTLPLNVTSGTLNGDGTINQNYGFGEMPGGFYNPQAVGAPLIVYASGVRNAYDLVWHSNGNLYVPTNGSAAGGRTPAIPALLPIPCSHRLDGVYSGPSNFPGLTGVSTQKDWLFRVVQNGYYGHPNPERCEWIMNGGDPTAGADPAEVVEYTDGTQPDPNYRGFAFDFSTNASANGVIEYQMNIYNGALRGKLLVVRYSAGKDIVVLQPNGTNGDIAQSYFGTDGFTSFGNPLDITEDTLNGNLYVIEFQNENDINTGRIRLLRPNDPNAAPIGVPDEYWVDQWGTLNVSAPGVLGNDYDQNGHAMTAQLNSAPGNAVSFVFNTNGSFSYQHNGLSVSEVSFTYSPQDSQTSGAETTVVIHINPVTPTPSDTPTPTATFTPTDTFTPTATNTLTDAEFTATAGGDTLTPSNTPTNTLTPTATYTPGGPTITPTYTEIPGNELLVNGSFEFDINGDKIPDDWSPKNLTSDKIKCNKDKDGDGIADKIFAFEGNCAVQFKGGAAENSKLVQTVDEALVTMGDTLFLSFAAKGKGVPANTGYAMLKVKYADDTKSKVKLNVFEGDTEYTSYVDSVTLSGTAVKLKVQTGYKGTVGKLIVDDISLIDLAGLNRLIPLLQTNNQLQGSRGN